MPYFFLSHAPGEDDVFVERFFADLSAEVRRRTGTDAPEVGFLDIPRPGERLWPIDARVALTTCQTFVALCSSRYFLSDRCGRTWGIFADRLRRHDLAKGIQASALIPVIWSSYGLPGDAFQEHGLDITPHHTPGGQDVRVLVRLSSNRAAYRAFVSSLAHHVVDVAHSQRLIPATPGTEIESAENAFEAHPRWADDGTRPQRVYLAVAAGVREQMRHVRDDLRFYGDRSEDWVPYHPAAAQPLVARACRIAADRLLDAEVISIDEIGGYLDAARERNEIVLLLVDAWATRLEALRDALRGVARRDAEFAVLVPASRDDPETVDHHPELRLAMLNTFAQGSGRSAATITFDIATLGGFDNDLLRALVDAQRRIFRSGRVFGAASGRSARARPILGGP